MQAVYSGLYRVSRFSVWLFGAGYLLIALAIGLPLFYGLLRLLKRSGDPR